MKRSMKALLVALALTSLNLGGCSSSRTPPTRGPDRASQLRELAGMLVLYSGGQRRGPSKASDLARYEAGYPAAYQAVRAGEVVVVWGATMPGEGEGGGTNAVIAYDRKAPTEGGYVLLHNGTVKEMTASEFKSAAKAKP